MAEHASALRFEKLWRGKKRAMATPIWMLVAVAVGAVIVTLAIVFVGFRTFVVSPNSPTVAGVTVAVTVRAYYEAINSRRFGDAYSILSSAAQASQSFASFAGRFNATRSIGVQYIDGVSIQGSSADLNAHPQTVTAGSAGLATSCSRVVWTLVVEGGQWRRDIRSESGNEFGERC